MFSRLRSLNILHYSGIAALVAWPVAQTAWSAQTAARGAVIDHGVATPISSPRGTVATVDGEGREVVVQWLMDHRGGHALLIVEAGTGKSQQVDLPFPIPGATVDAPYASLLSTRNRFYTHFASHFIEFDVATRAFTFSRRATPRFAMGMTEDDNGVIWTVTYPQSGVMSFDPKSARFRDYGEVYRQPWAQYQRHMAADDAGWIYFALGMAASQVVALNPETGEATPLLAETERKKGTAYVYRATDGKVYGQALHGPREAWFELHRGQRRTVDRSVVEKAPAKPIVTGSQSLFHATFPSGRRIKASDLVTRTLTTEDPRTQQIATVTFDYESDGAHIMGVALAPDGALFGGTAFPMRFFSFNPVSQEWIRRPAYGQWNALAGQNGRIFVGGYGGGFLLEWDPARPWLDTVKGQADRNPAFLTECTPDIHRPHRVFAHPDGKTIILGGAPQYGYTGGGLLFWDRAARRRVLLRDADVVPDQSTMSMVALPEGKLLGGTSTTPGSGGQKKATAAELYIMDFATRKVEWHAALPGGAQQILDLFSGPGGFVFGLADRKTFFVFDPVKRVIVHQRDVAKEFGLSATGQGPRVFVSTPEGAIHLLFRRGIATLNTETFALELVAESSVPIEVGGAYHEGRVYFVNASHLYSVGLAKAGR